MFFFLPTYFAFLIRKMKHESFSSQLNQQQQQKQKTTIYYISTRSKFEKDHSLNKKTWTKICSTQRTPWCDLKLVRPLSNPSIDHRYTDLLSAEDSEG